MKEIADCFNNFDNIKPLFDTIEGYFNINIGIDENDTSGQEHPYYDLIKPLKKRFLGADADKFFKECSNLREILNSLV